jgi:hypothetical protein
LTWGLGTNFQCPSCCTLSKYFFLFFQEFRLNQMDAHLLCWLYIFARKRAEMVHVYHRPLVPIEHLFGTFFAQSLAQLGAAIARGMALRAFGTSSMGLSKVFLRHIAPERAREDQNLTTGPHFSAGHAQWRYALAT